MRDACSFGFMKGNHARCTDGTYEILG
jgi:hypothetical protein